MMLGLASLALVVLSVDTAAQGADVRVTNSRLMPVCVNGARVADKARRWRLTDTTTFVFTMRNDRTSGVESLAAGFASVDFTPEPGHRYEVEVRSDASSYSQRAWTAGNWKPVVRDRTTDRIVSSEPRGRGPGCGS